MERVLSERWFLLSIWDMVYVYDEHNGYTTLLHSSRERVCTRETHFFVRFMRYARFFSNVLISSFC